MDYAVLHASVSIELISTDFLPAHDMVTRPCQCGAFDLNSDMSTPELDKPIDK